MSAQEKEAAQKKAWGVVDDYAEARGHAITRCSGRRTLCLPADELWDKAEWAQDGVHLNGSETNKSLFITYLNEGCRLAGLPQMSQGQKGVKVLTPIFYYIFFIFNNDNSVGLCCVVTD